LVLLNLSNIRATPPRRIYQAIKNFTGPIEKQGGARMKDKLFVLNSLSFILQENAALAEVVLGGVKKSG
jgi:hypothetical protein